MAEEQERSGRERREIARLRRALSTTRLAHRRAWEGLDDETRAQVARETPWVVPGARRRSA